FASERHAPAFQIFDALRRPPRDDLDDCWVGEEVRFAQSIGGVLLPAILGIHGAERGVDAARGERGVCIVRSALADREYLYAPFGKLDRSTKTSSSGADHEH